MAIAETRLPSSSEIAVSKKIRGRYAIAVEKNNTHRLTTSERHTHTRRKHAP